MAAQKRFRLAGHTSAPALPGTGTGTGTGTGGHVSFDMPSSSAGGPPADIRPTVPAPPPPAPGPDVVVANPVAGTGATAYPSDLPPITTLSMLRTQPPFAWKLDLPGRKRAREEFVATRWEIEVETQDGAREPPLKISFPCAITHPTPGGGWKEGERVIALYAYRPRGGHWRMDCCVPGRAGVPAGQLRRLAALAVTGVRGWGDRVEEHMSYAWLQMLTRAKEEQRRHLGEVGGVVDVDAEEGEGQGGDASSMRSSRSGGSKGKVGRPRKAPTLPAKSGGQPSAAKPPPAAHVDVWVAAQAGAMPEWQKRVVAAEGEVLLLRGKLQEAEQRAQEAERRATAAERERDVLRAQARKPKPKPGQQQEVGRAEGGGQRPGGGGERRGEVPHGGEPGLEVPGREGEGGALSSGRHRAPAAWPESGGGGGCPLIRWRQGIRLPWTAMSLWRSVTRGTPWWRPPLTLPSSPPRPPRPRALGAPLALQASSVTLRTALFNPCTLHRGLNMLRTSRDSLPMRDRPSRPLSWDFLRTSHELRANLYSIFV